MSVNVVAVIVAAASSFLLGGAWYSKRLLGSLWNREAGVKPEGKQGHPAKVFAASFVFSLIAAWAFAAWIGPEVSLASAVTQGAVAGGCFVAASFGINYQFAGRSTLMWLIDGGYHVAQFMLYGVVLGLWR